jgi:hypothetical protein
LERRLNEIRGERNRTRDRGDTLGPAGTLGAPETNPSKWKWRHLPPRDRELLEILSLEPELFVAARQAIPPEDLLSEPARRIYALYEQLHEQMRGQGEELEFSRMLGEAEDEQLQSLLVDMDEEAQKKGERISQSPSERLEELIESFQRLQRDQDGHRRVDEMHRIQDEQQELDRLQEIVELTRQRQGLTAPTDG